MSNFIAGIGICSNCNQTNNQGNLCFHCQINQEISAPSTSQTVSFPANRCAQIIFHILEPKNGFDGLGISLNDSYLITSIDPESPAELSGLRPSLLLVDINGKNVKKALKSPGKHSASKSNLSSLKHKFGSCLGLKSAVDSEAQADRDREEEDKRRKLRSSSCNFGI